MGLDTVFIALFIGLAILATFLHRELKKERAQALGIAFTLICVLHRESERDDVQARLSSYARLETANFGAQKIPDPRARHAFWKTWAKSVVESAEEIGSMVMNRGGVAVDNDEIYDAVAGILDEQFVSRQRYPGEWG